MVPITVRADATRSRFRRIIAVLALVTAVFAGLGTALASLRSVQTDSQAGLLNASEISLLFTRIDALEWEAVATGGTTSELREGLESSEAELQLRLAKVPKNRDGMRLDDLAAQYLQAVEEEIEALDAGNIELVQEIDETRVDPLAESLNETIGDIRSRLDEQANRTGTSVNLLSWAIVALTGLTCAVLWLISARLRDKQREAMIRSALDERVRAVIEVSADLFTVVGTQDALTVLSPHLGPLAGVIPSANPACEEQPASMTELLPEHVLSAWKAADGTLRETRKRQTFHSTLATPSGPLHLEAHGNVLGGGADQRVWAWRDVTEQKELELQLVHEAFHDPLTGVANRSLLANRTDHALKMAARLGRPVSLLFGDLDGFKGVNDTLGHSEGDNLLKVVTRRIESCLRPGDTLARLGGDEFAVLLEDGDNETALAIAERILRVVAVAVEVGSRTLFPSISIGVATATESTTTDELLRNADLAMYSAKASGRGRAESFVDDMHQLTDDALALTTDLRTALEDGQLTLSYQPTIDLANGQVEGVEALIRWNHPVRGLIPPDKFIPLAESNGMIISIGKWVLEEACRAAVKLQRIDCPPYLMAVNLSPEQLRDPFIIDIVSNALTQADLAPELLVLEVTEGALLADNSAVQRLRGLRDLGVAIAVDDFGTGYTSINYLQNLPISILKIDRSFVSGSSLAPNERRAFLSAIVGLAQSLNLRSVAEGIENEAELSEMRELGCDVGQGYLWSPATPEPTLVKTIARLETRTGEPVAQQTQSILTTK